MSGDSDNLIVVKDLSKVFKLPHEKSSSLKSMTINWLRRKRGFELQEALNNVSFTVKKGDFFGIVGRNGSGKSTLLKLLAGIYIPTKGNIQMNGSLTPFIELGVGFNAELSGRDNVYLNGALLGFNRKQMERMYEEIVEFAELRRFMDQKLKNYSTGMQVRLAFSIAIRARSDILLLDEVLAVGDVAFQQKCFNYFEELKQQGKTVVFVSHDMAAIRRFCNKAIFLKNGKLADSGTAEYISDVYAEENINPAAPGKKKTTGPRSYQLTAVIKDQSPESATIEINYRTKETKPMYIGLSVVRDGISLAEISTVDQLDVSRSGKITYKLDTTMFNGGTYRVGGALFRLKNKELLTVLDQQPEIVIKGHDPTKGAALKLDHNWKVGNG